MIRSAISPRFAMRMRWNTGLHRLEAEEGFAVLARGAVLDQHVDEAAGLGGLDLVHQLHRPDDAEPLALLHHGADVAEGRFLPRGRPGKGADARRVYGE